MAKKIKTTTYNFPVIIEKDEDGFFVADCPDLPGCHTQGKTLEEAITNIRDAIKLNLKILKEETNVKIVDQDEIKFESSPLYFDYLYKR